jgi:HEAT repeat protein
MMLSTLIALLLSPPLLQDPPAEEPAPEAEVQEEVSPKEAAAHLKELLKGKDYLAQAAALEELGSIEDKGVVKAVAAALKSKDKLVLTAAIRALRYNPEPNALAELLKRKKDKAIVEDPELAVEYYYALGQSGSAKAIPVLVDGLFTGAKGDKVARARIASLGHIRDKESVDELMGYMVSSRGRAGGPRYMQDVRAALVVLTGEDHGTNTLEWVGWWNDNKAKLKISPEEWPLPNAKMQRQWRLLWATPEEKEAARKEREERRERGEETEEDEDSDEGGGGAEGGGA